MRVLGDNVFLVKNGQLLTPSDGVRNLDGITPTTVIDTQRRTFQNHFSLRCHDRRLLLRGQWSS